MPFNNYSIRVPEAILDSWIRTDEGKPISAAAMKALLYCVSFCDGCYFQQTVVSISDLCAMFGHTRTFARSSNHSHHAARIVSHLESITGKPLLFRKLRGTKTFSMNCILSVESDIRTDTLTVCFSEEFIRYYESGVKHSRYINMHELFSLRSNPASMLYFYCIAYRYDCPSKNIPVKDLTKLLTGNPDYPYKLLKKDMILPALKRINELTGWSLHLTEYRNGNRVAEICFLPQETSIESGNDGALDE